MSGFEIAIISIIAVMALIYLVPREERVSSWLGSVGGGF
jgi:hypothetical protein